MKNLLSVLTMLFIVTKAFAQESEKVEMAEALYADGKIYVVVTVLSVIFIGIVAYLVMLDKKISKLEKEASTK